MAAVPDSLPGSPLSEHGSEEFEDHIKLETGRRRSAADDDLDDDDDEGEELPAMLPATKSKRSGGARGFRVTTPPPDIDMLDGDISSDTEGEAPSSPSAQTGGVPFEEEAEQQVTRCRWRACQAGDLVNMDELVKHIHKIHIGARQKKYACEWEGCTRIDATHASGYALRAHMRSHTREKPFFCTLPECDKSFTRSDALAKHMRTVHEAEALRPSDPVPRYHSSLTAKQPKLKLVFGKAKGNDSAAASAPQPLPDEQVLQYVMNNSGYPSSCEFTAEELALTPEKLYNKMRVFVKLAEEEGEKLKAECDELELHHREEWKKKQAILLNVIEGVLVVESQAGKVGQKQAPATPVDILSSLLPTQPLGMQSEEKCFWRHIDDGWDAGPEGSASHDTRGLKTEMDTDTN